MKKVAAFIASAMLVLSCVPVFAAGSSTAATTDTAAADKATSPKTGVVCVLPVVATTALAGVVVSGKKVKDAE